MPAWLIALQLAIQLEPALVDGVQKLIALNNLPQLTPEQMAALQATMDKAVSDYKAAIAQ